MLDPMERLASANPVQDCPPLPLDQLQQALATPSRTRRHTTAVRRRLALGGSVLALAATLIVLLVVVIGSGTSIVSRAYAATSSSTEILYYTVTHEETTVGIADGRRVQDRGPTTVSHVWTLGSRWHAISMTPALHSRYIQSTGGSTEVAVNGNIALEYSSVQPTTIERVVASSSSCGKFAFEFAQSICGNPVEQLHALLGTKQLKMTGTATFDGKRVDVLTGSIRGARGSAIAGSTVRVLVSPTTSLPLQVTATQLVPNKASGTGYVLTGAIDAETYSNLQHLSTTKANLSLLKLRAHPGTTVVTRHTP